MTSSLPPTPNSNDIPRDVSRRRIARRRQGQLQLGWMIVLGSLIGGLGAIATHDFLDSTATRPDPEIAVGESAPAQLPADSPVPGPSGSHAGEEAVIPGVGVSPETVTAIAPEPAALASFSPIATTASLNPAANPTDTNPADPLAQLWTRPVAMAKQQTERVNLAYQVQSGGIPKQFQGKVIYGGGLAADNKVIALTFDDGPWPETTAAMMNLLKQHGGKGTFFVVGNLVRRYPELVKRMVDEGHEVANHTWTHRTAYSPPAIAARELDTTEAEIAKYTGFKTRIYRPPGGILNNGLVNYARGKGYAILMWSTDTLDWRYRRADSIRQRILRTLKPGGVVLMHDGGGPRWATVKALSQVLPELKAKGYRFVTVSELLWIREQQTRQTAAASATQQATTQQGTPVQSSSVSQAP